MRSMTTSFAALAAAVLVAGNALAQTPPAPTPAPAGGTPDQMAFVTPYGTPITAERASRLVAAVLAELRKHPSWQFDIAVVDPAGELVYFYRMENAQFASIGNSMAKARTAARYRRETRIWYNAFEAGHHYLSTIDPTLVASPGGFPLIENGKVIGAIACSGGTGDQDAAACKAGADALATAR